MFPDSLRLDLLDPATHREYASRPERLIELVTARPAETVVIDEIQKVPELLEPVHLLIEQRAAKRFVLTGSSARKLRMAGVNLLAGRAVERHLHPFMAAELGKAFCLETALKIGMLPLVRAAADPHDTLRAYSGLYVRDEVQMEGLVRNVGAFARFLEAISFSHAGVLNITEVARESQVGRKAVEGYLGILEDLLLGYRLDVFRRRAKRELAAHPKFYYFDAGVFRSLRPAGPFDRPEEIDGAALEGLVGQHLRAWCGYFGRDYRLFYWHTRTRLEVDFVLYGPKGIFAFEVKNAARVRRDDLRGLRAFGEDYPTSRRFLLYRGKETLQMDDITCLPCELFLRGLLPDSLPGEL